MGGGLDFFCSSARYYYNTIMIHKIVIVKFIVINHFGLGPILRTSTLNPHHLGRVGVCLSHLRWCLNYFSISTHKDEKWVNIK
jgi:hypothetical protein